MSRPGARKPLSELIPCGAAALRPKPAKIRQVKTPGLAAPSYESLAPMRGYGPGSAVARAAKLRNMSVERWLREYEQRKRADDPWLRDITGRLRQIRTQLLEPQSGR